jgi:hypothetical protein
MKSRQPERPVQASNSGFRPGYVITPNGLASLPQERSAVLAVLFVPMFEIVSRFFSRIWKIFPPGPRSIPGGRVPVWESVRGWLTFHVGQRREGAGAGWHRIRKTEFIPFQPRNQRNEFRTMPGA